MIIEYHCPETLNQALELLARTDPAVEKPVSLRFLNHPLGGGTFLATKIRQSENPVSLVDLQLLPIHEIEQEGQWLAVGAAATLQQLYECEHIPEGLRESLRLENETKRARATVAGTIVTCDGRSPFITALLALDPRLVWAQVGQAENTQEALGDYLALRAPAGLQPDGRLMISIRIPLNADLCFESVARSPLDRPIVCAAVAQWRSGGHSTPPSRRTRLTLGGYGKAPILALDGPEADGIGMAARSAYLSAGDAWASAEYRSEIAGVLAERLTAQLEKAVQKPAVQKPAVQQQAIEKPRMP